MFAPIIKIFAETLSFVFWWKRKKIEDSENPEKRKEARSQKINKAISENDQKSINTNLDNLLS